ncbi:VOC family protein [Brachybacterium hainanense]|uniref:VOC family protein n=1 Tax=Brachybacterium hainanense TaxID=1541174 RepID=A0ABV6REF1_9MICO
MSIPALLDHIVIAGPDLAEVIRWFEERTGVRAAPGGVHPTGTANALVALSIGGRRGPQYIELIGPDPDRPDPALPQAFGIPRLTEPTLVTYAVHPADLDAVLARARAEGYDPGDVQDLSRRAPSGELLRWRLSRAPEPRRPEVPFLIDWGATAHPGLGDLPVIELLSFTRAEPDPEALHLLTDALGLGDGVAEIREGTEARYLLRLRAAEGSELEL